MAESTLTQKGQTTIPRMIREHLGLHPGDRIEFVADEPGRVVLLRASHDIRELAGALPKPAKPVSIGAMQAAIRRRAQKHR